MVKRFSLFVFISTFFIALQGCSESEDDGEVTNVSSLAEITGLWDWSDDYGGCIDEWYLYIAPDGWMSDFDYDGDCFDAGANCYYPDRNWARISHVSGNSFIVNYATTSDTFTAAIDSSGALLLTNTGSDPGVVDRFPPTSMNIVDIEGMTCFALKPSQQDPGKLKTLKHRLDD